VVKEGIFLRATIVNGMNGRTVIAYILKDGKVMVSAFGVNVKMYAMATLELINPGQIFVTVCQDDINLLGRTRCLGGWRPRGVAAAVANHKGRVCSEKRRIGIGQDYPNPNSTCQSSLVFARQPHPLLDVTT
jgi:hypothetical protein